MGTRVTRRLRGAHRDEFASPESVLENPVVDVRRSSPASGTPGDPWSRLGATAGVGFFGKLGAGNYGNDGSLEALLAHLRERHLRSSTSTAWLQALTWWRSATASPPST